MQIPCKATWQYLCPMSQVSLTVARLRGGRGFQGFGYRNGMGMVYLMWGNGPLGEYFVTLGFLGVSGVYEVYGVYGGFGRG